MQTNRWKSAIDPLRVAQRIEATYEAGGWPLRAVLILCLWPMLASTRLLRVLSERADASSSGGRPWVGPLGSGRSTGLG